MGAWTPSTIGDDRDDLRTLLARILAAQVGGGGNVQTAWLPLFPSASRTTSVNSSKIDVTGYSRLLLAVNVTAYTAGAVRMQLIDEDAWGAIIAMEQGSPDLVAVGYTYIVWQSMIPSQSLTGRLSIRACPLPKMTTIRAAHSTADAITYEAKYALLQ